MAEWYLLTCVHSVTDAASAEKNCILAEKYMFGYGVPKSYDLAFKLYSVSHLILHSPRFLLFALGFCKLWISRCMMLGAMYENGLGQNSDFPAAISWYKEGASKNSATCYNKLGKIYLVGKGVPKDATVAAEYFLKAAEMGDLDAQTNLGTFVEFNH